MCDRISRSSAIVVSACPRLESIVGRWGEAEVVEDEVKVESAEVKVEEPAATEEAA